MSNFKDVTALNLLIGNPLGDVADLDWPKIKIQFDLIKEEFEELEQAVAAKDFTELRDGAADILVTTYGLVHMVGIDADSDMREVHSSNMSKFCTSREDALATAQKYEDIGLEVMFRYPNDELIAVVSAKSQDDNSFKYYPKGKLLKSVSFIEPNLN